MRGAHFVPSWDEVKSVTNLATLFEPAFSTCDQLGHKLKIVSDLYTIFRKNFWPTWPEVNPINPQLWSNWAQVDPATGFARWLLPKLGRSQILNLWSSWPQVARLSKRAVTSAHVGRKLNVWDFRTSCPEVKPVRLFQFNLNWISECTHLPTSRQVGAQLYEIMKDNLSLFMKDRHRNQISPGCFFFVSNFPTTCREVPNNATSDQVGPKWNKIVW